MVYIKRGGDGRVVAVSEEALPGFDSVEETDAELRRFLAGMRTRDALDQSDLEFIRVVEDVIELLIAKNIILFTELPNEAQEKMLKRQHLRRSVQSSLDLLSDESF